MSALLIALISFTGCVGQGGGAGRLRAVSLGDEPVALYGNYNAVYYAHDPDAGTSFMLSDRPVEELIEGQMPRGQIMHVELLWLPKPGRTPMDPSATNASIRYVVIADGEVGMYSGAGFANLAGSPQEGDSLTLTLRDASLQLQESTPGFVDLLSPAQLTGTFTAARDDKKARQLNRAASQLVTNALGKTQYVMLIEAESRQPKAENLLKR